ncbi:LysM peptidoglycan-binding domain-containing protein [Winogradskyella psychrotolerans]|uniref:LysM peptidoglycan-binding domain-containing protein n=1 Tax=Winogradskyella psychrotolerans TaxID=1344585 RepID=UPI001C0776C8|nr:LysM peptidoglycan-binding domain-containing protein [Winogradskyella psychrotolerans]MBU2930003.1 LysM peptidoglycan-binding domain-containing protein [Winogradskyella psychrotolerans]
MQNSFKLILTFLISFTSLLSSYAQDEVKFKDVILDGKPAKLNSVTGEITFVELETEVVETKIDSVDITPKLVTDSNVNDASNTSEAVNLDNDSDFHIVKEGDNLFKLSVKYKTSLGQLQEANNLETTLIREGQKLRIRNFDKVNEDEKSLIWVVKKGDNLYRIALENGTTVKELKRLNGLNSDVIKIGQRLQLK